MTVTTDRAAAAGERQAARATPRRRSLVRRQFPGSGRGPTAEHLSRADRVARGKDARTAAPLESQAEFRPGQGRDPVGLLLGQAASRVPELVPVRHGRMLVSPFTYYRGAALPMAADLANTPAAGLRVQVCGDAHLSNFGAFASPERNLVFDVNDFDETLPGPFEWDVKRLAASLIVAGRDNGFPAKANRKLALAAAEGYRTAMRAFAEQTFLDVWYAHLDVEPALSRGERPRSRPSGSRCSRRCWPRPTPRTAPRPWPSSRPRSTGSGGSSATRRRSSRSRTSSPMSRPPRFTSRSGPW